MVSEYLELQKATRELWLMMDPIIRDIVCVFIEGCYSLAMDNSSILALQRFECVYFFP